MGIFTAELTSNLLKTPHMEDLIRKMIGKAGWGWMCLATAVRDLHDGRNSWGSNGESIYTSMPPKIVFITATSSVAYAFAMKQAWKVAFADPPPKFFTIDVSNRRFGESFSSKSRLSPTEMASIEEETVGRLEGLGRHYDSFKEAALFDEFQVRGGSLQRAKLLLEKAGFTKIRVMEGLWGHSFSVAIPERYRPIIRKSVVFDFYQEPSYKKLFLNINPDSRAFIADMKTIGREMGNEIVSRRSTFR